MIQREPATVGSGLARFDVAAQPPLLRDVLDLAHRQPHLPGRDTGAEGLVGGPAADAR